MSIEKQKYILGIENKYKDKEGNTIYYEYKRWVLDKIQKEIARYTDINFEYKAAKKQGRRILSHEFIIRKNIPQNVAKPLLETKKSKAIALISDIEVEAITKEVPARPSTAITTNQDILQILQNWGGRRAIIDAIIEKHDADKIRYQIKHAQRIQKEKSVKNLFGWFKKALEEDYRDPEQEQKVKKALAKAKQQQQQTASQTKEQALRLLKSNKYQEEKTLVIQLLAKTPTLLDETITNLEKSSSTIRREIQKGKTPAVIFQNVRMQGIVIEEVKKQFPKAFQSIEIDFAKKKAEWNR